jgi:uncharacterized membrane protein YoaK (UPF0700 family)
MAMDFIDATLHALNFMMPALFVALFVSIVGYFYKKNKTSPPALYRKFAINFIVCSAVLWIGLIVTGRDGKMLTYIAMVIASGTVQWVMSGAWRK